MMVWNSQNEKYTGGYGGEAAKSEGSMAEIAARLTIGNMSPDVSDLLKKALELPAEARAALASSLLESLDEAVDLSAEEEWNKEIARRIAELDSGKVKPVPWA